MGSLPFVVEKVQFTVFDENDVLIQQYEVDASLSETHTKQMDVTEHPVSRGIPVTDNIRSKARRFTLVCMFTDYPARIDDAIAKAANGKSAKESLEILEDYASQGWRFNIRTSLRTYENMVIESINVPRTNEKSNYVEATISFKEIRKASSVKKKLPDRKKAKPKKDKGPQAKKAVKPARAKGMTKQLLDSAIKGIKKLSGGLGL